MKKYCQVEIDPGSNAPKKSFSLRRGLGLQALAEKQETGIEFDCREAGCGICIVRVQGAGDGLSAPTEAESDFLSAMQADADERLACQCRVVGDVRLSLENFF